MIMHQRLDTYVHILYHNFKSGELYITISKPKIEKTKYLMWLCLISNIEGFSHQVTKTSCLDEALTLHACKLSLPSFVNPLRTSFLSLYLIRIMK